MPEKQNKNLVSVSPAEVWGKVITELRDRNLRLLFIACGEISNVEVKDNLFIISTQENTKAIIENTSNLQILQEIVAKYLPNCKIFVKEETEQSQNIVPQKLIELFGDKLIIE